MAGLGNSTIANATFIKIKEGSVVVTIKESQEDKYPDLLEAAKKVNQVTSKTSNDVYLECCFGEFEGYLKRISKKVVEFNGAKTTQYNISFEADGKNFIWAIPQDSMLVQGFFNCLSSIKSDFGLIKLYPWLHESGKTRLTVYNDGEKLNWGVALEDIPKGEIVETFDKGKGELVPFLDPKTGKEVYDYTKRIAFFDVIATELNVKVQPFVGAVDATDQASDPEVNENIDPQLTTGEDDDVPF